MTDDNRTKAAKAVQALIRSTPLTLFGSGYSCGHGLPSMAELGNHLIDSVGPKLVSGEAKLLWESVLPQVRANLEDGLNKIASGASGREEVVHHVRTETARLIIDRSRDSELKLLASGSATDATARLLKRLYEGAPQNADCVPVITTNYDTLIEFFCDLAQLPLETGFSGYRLRRLRGNPLFETHYRRFTVTEKNRTYPSYKTNLAIRLLKPHGSITWQMIGGSPTEMLCDLADAPRAIVVPGPSKYEDATVNALFDSMRTEMNSVVNRASALLCIGFGFNDAHLESVIRTRLEMGMPVLILVKEFTPNISSLLAKYPHVIGIQQNSGGGEVHLDTTVTTYLSPIWQLDAFMKEFLE